MNNEQADGKITQLKGKIKETWGKLTDNDIMLIDGKRDQLVGKVVEAHGITREVADKQLKALEDACGCGSSKAA